MNREFTKINVQIIHLHVSGALALLVAYLFFILIVKFLLLAYLLLKCKISFEINGLGLYRLFVGRLRVSYCDRPLSVVRRPWSINFYFKRLLFLSHWFKFKITSD